VINATSAARVNVTSGTSGVVMSSHLRTATSRMGLRMVRESVRCAEWLSRVMQPRYSIELHANRLALSRLDREHPHHRANWRVVNGTLDARLEAMLRARGAAEGRDRYLFEAYLFKLSSLLATSFARALFLDSDVSVRQPDLVHLMLTTTLEISDLAAPVDVARHKWLADTFEAAPPLCSCMLAFHNSAAVQQLWLGAAQRLIDVSHPEVRQGDQEMIYFEWVHARRALRVLVLPEEWYCPIAAATWASPHGEVMQCRANHYHAAGDQRALKATRPWHSFKAAMRTAEASRRGRNRATAAPSSHEAWHDGGFL